MSPLRPGRTFKFPDPKLERAASELFRVLQIQNIGTSQIDMVDLIRVLGARIGPRQLRPFRDLVSGDYLYQRLVGDSTATKVNAFAPQIFATSCQITSAQSTLSGLLNLNQTDSGGSANCISTVQASTVDTILDDTGAKLTSGGAWQNSSSGRLKSRFRDIPNEEVVNRARGLLVREWSYEKEDRPGRPPPRHVGPTSEEFFATFGLGDAKSISGVDLAGVALRYGQATDAELVGLRARVETLEDENQTLRGRVDDLVARVEALEATV